MASRILCERTKAVFVLNVEIAREGERILALDLVRRDRNRREIGAQREFMEGEQRTRGRENESLHPLQRKRSEPDGRPILIGLQDAAMRADRLALVSGQRIEANSVSASVSLMRSTCARLRVRALAERRKCCDIPATYQFR